MFALVYVLERPCEELEMVGVTCKAVGFGYLSSFWSVADRYFF